MGILTVRGIALSAAMSVALAGVFAGPSWAQQAAPLRPVPLNPTPPSMTAEQVDGAVAKIDSVVLDAMDRTGVPGVAVAVVYRDQVVFAKGYGVREVGKPEPIDTDTVFMFASVSKPIASTVVARLVGQGLFDWHDPVKQYDPSFELSDPYVTSHATFADLLSHRSGLGTGAGDLLEDLGYDRDYILGHLKQQPLDSFRTSYHYSNFGYTAGGQAAAVAAGRTWEDLAEDTLFKPLGMTRSSYRHADYMAHENRARIHAIGEDPAGPAWVAKYERYPDAEAPAGGASGSIADLAQFLRLQLAEGSFDGKRIVDAAALAATHAPQQIPGPPRTPTSRAGFYGFGWNVSYDERGYLGIGHSGAFYLGAATSVNMVPGEELGIAVLTNAAPIGVAEAIANSFIDIAQNGAQTVDWLGFYGMIFQAMRNADAAGFDYAEPPAAARKPGPLAEYAGVYGNDYYGPITISLAGDALSMTLGPADSSTTRALRPFDGDTFTFETFGENAVGPAGAAFVRDDSGAVTAVVLDYYDTSGLGTFRRVAGN